VLYNIKQNSKKIKIKVKKAVKKLSKSCQKAVKKLLKVVKKLSKSCQKCQIVVNKCQKVFKVVKKFDPTFVPPEPSWSLVDQRPNCLPRKKLAKAAQKLFFAKKLS
jgi:hypothetical protein